MGTVGVGEGGFDREQWRISLGPILDLWTRLKESNDGLLSGGKGLKSSPRKKGGKGAKEEERKSGEGGKEKTPPVEIFVDVENDFAANLCNTVNADLQAINKVVFGSGLLTPSVLKVAGELMKGVVPSNWEKIYEGYVASERSERAVRTSAGATTRQLRIARFASVRLQFV